MSSCMRKANSTERTRTNDTQRDAEHPLSIVNMFRSSGPGSLSRTTTWNRRSWTTSYTPTKCAGIAPRASRWRIVTLGGSQGPGGQSEMSMSKPSSWVVGGRVRARSRSQILWGRKGGLDLWVCLFVCVFDAGVLCCMHEGRLEIVRVRGFTAFSDCEWKGFYFDECDEDDNVRTRFRCPRLRF